MPIYFKSREPESYVIYMGKDKYENEELIAYGFPEDIWFHVDDLSSAHVYLRLKPNETIRDISPQVLEDCAQLVKLNSISGCKLPSVSVVYTPWSNLKKTPGMDVGQVGFRDDSLVLKYKVQKKLPAVLNALQKTRQERFDVNLKEQYEARQRDIRSNERAAQEERRKKEKEAIEENKRLKEMKSYSGFMDEEKMVTNRDGNIEDDFW